MLLFPAIDLKDGKCVRLLRGDMAKATVFNDSPAAQAKAFANAGCEWLHLVDLNGADEGHPVNRAAVQSILKEVKVPAQLGGGIRTIESIAQWIDAGVQRVILGTVAVKEPGLVKAACKQWPNQIAVGIDARDGLVAVDGWTKQSTVRALDLALRFEDAGIAAIIYTDIDRDHALASVDADRDLARPLLAGGLHQPRLLDRDGPQDDAAHAGVEPLGDALDGADAAAELGRHLDFLQDFDHRRAVHRMAFDRAVEVDEM
jgi:phosphoribosylformimino-5-aminoimidazole carboxamide ribotide isomerase